MKISFLSDVHLEFGAFDAQLPGGDVCLLAGDILVARKMRKESGVHVQERWAQFVEEQLSKYKKTYIITGNHEYYGSAWSDATEVLKEAVGDSAQYLENETVTLKEGVVLFASTFWTDLKNLDYFVVDNVKRSMNDYHSIKKIEKNGNWRRLHPEDTFEENIEARRALQNALEEHSDKQMIVMTHHCPTSLSSLPKWGGPANLMNYAFYNTGLENMILDHPNLKYWIHGHTHDPLDYMVGECRVLCNPRGYHGHERTGYNPKLQIEV